MEFEKLTAQVRSGRKKGVARRLRRDGQIPAVCYGPDIQPLSLSVDPVVLKERYSGNLGRNAVLEMTVEGEGAPNDPLLVMLQDYQYHPVSRDTLHVDFLHVSMDREVRIKVPFVLSGKAEGVKIGGIQSQVFRSLPVLCTPDKIPAKLELDVSDMNLGDIRKVSDLKLPEGVVVEYGTNQTLVSITAPTVVAASTEEEEAAEEPVSEAEE